MFASTKARTSLLSNATLHSLCKFSQLCQISIGDLTPIKNPAVYHAFSGDAIPTHLLTREAMTLYLAHLARPDSILAVNILTLVIVALSIIYLDAYRNQLRDERKARILVEARTAALAIDRSPRGSVGELLRAIGGDSRSRLRLYDRSGKVIEDSWVGAPHTYALRDPINEAWRKNMARSLDRGFNVLVGAATPEQFTEPVRDLADAWPEVRLIEALRNGLPWHEHVAASELLKALDGLADEGTTRLNGWPRTPMALSGTLKRLAPNLRAVGGEVEIGRNKNRRFIKLRKVGDSSVTTANLYVHS